MLATEVARYLAAQGVGTYDASGSSGTIFVRKKPDKPNAAICVYPGPGRSGEGTAYYFPGIQVLVRGGTSGSAGDAVAHQVFDRLNLFCGKRFVPGGEYVVRCDAAQPPVRLGPDSLGRQEYSVNFDLMVYRAPLY